jgi:uncharacterized protein with beta-barrel porin domain
VRDAFLSPDVFSVDLATVRADLNGIGFDRAPAALGSLSGELHALTAAGAAGSDRQFSGAVARRQKSVRRGVSTQAESSVEAGGHETTLWVEAVGGFADADADVVRGADGYDVDGVGLAMGGDRAVAEHGRAGVALGVVQNDLDQGRLRSSASITSYQIGGYAVFDFGRSFVDVQAGYGLHTVDTRRILITGPAAERRAKGHADVHALNGSVTAGLNLGSDNFAVRPVAVLSYAWVDGVRLKETGAGDAGLIVRDNGYEALTGATGLEMDGKLGSTRPFGRIAFAYDLTQDGYRTTNRFIGGGDAFRIWGARPGRTAVQTDLGFTATVAGKFELKAAYGLELRDHMTAQNLSLGASFRW